MLCPALSSHGTLSAKTPSSELAVPLMVNTIPNVPRPSVPWMSNFCEERFMIAAVVLRRGVVK